MTDNGQLIGNILVVTRRNQDRSVTFYLRATYTDAGTVNHRLFRTESAPTRANLREWEHKARTACYEMQQAQATPLVATGPIPTILEAADEHIKAIAGQVAPGTAARREKVLNIFMDCLPNCGRGMKIDQIERSHVHGPKGFERTRAANVSNDTLAGELSSLSSWFKWLTKTYGVALPAIDKPRLAGKPRPEIISQARAREIVDTCRPDVRDAITVLALTGLRQGELRGLPVAAWDSAAGVLHVPPGQVERTKRHQRDIPVGRACAAILSRLATGDGLLFRAADGGNLNYRLNTALRPFGISPHDLRRWFISALVRAGCPDKWIDQLSGHVHGSDDRYVNGTADEMRGYVQAVEDELFSPAATAAQST